LLLLLNIINRHLPSLKILYLLHILWEIPSYWLIRLLRVHRLLIIHLIARTRHITSILTLYHRRIHTILWIHIWIHRHILIHIVKRRWLHKMTHLRLRKWMRRHHSHVRWKMRESSHHMRLHIILHLGSWRHV